MGDGHFSFLFDDVVFFISSAKATPAMNATIGRACFSEFLKSAFKIESAIKVMFPVCVLANTRSLNKNEWDSKIPPTALSIVPIVSDSCAIYLFSFIILYLIR